ncbi:AraC family transcriptional regulator [Ruegeria arenilitoris]|uniref:AraC family transcriptional regulator n=1 Tax=Ruegeria arenilitoris TaxID=1173585 RepID=UPI0014819D3D|nr:AraC family transcriptional regulator [Ruegeria arenilitoris]
MANSIPMITATLLAGIPEFVGAELGDRALRRAYSDAGLHNGATSAAGQYVAEGTLVNLLESAARQAGDDTLGTLIGAHVNLGVYDTWGAYVLEAETLGDALRRFSVVMRFLASHSTAGLVVTGQQACLNYRWGARDTLGYHQVCLASAGSLLNTLRLYLGQEFLPDEIHLDMARPPRTTPIESSLQTRIFFDANEISLRFPRYLLKRQRPGPLIARPVTLSEVRRHVLTGPPRNIDEAVTELIRTQVFNGGPSFERTSRALNLNERTLRRMLDRSGEGFRDLSNRIRLETAEELLRGTSMSVRAVAKAVGYSDSYNFSRAFKNRYGCRPTAVRSF